MKIPKEVQQAAKALKFRNTILVYLLVDHPDLFLKLDIHQLRGLACRPYNQFPELVGQALW
jgi:hypothetical protein